MLRWFGSVSRSCSTSCTHRCSLSHIYHTWGLQTINITNGRKSHMWVWLIVKQYFSCIHNKTVSKQKVQRSGWDRPVEEWLIAGRRWWIWATHFVDDHTVCVQGSFVLLQMGKFVRSDLICCKAKFTDYVYYFCDNLIWISKYTPKPSN